MDVPRRGLRSIDAGFDAKESPFDHSGDESGSIASHIFLAPFDKPTRPGWNIAILVSFLVFFGSLAHGWIFHACLNGLFTATALISTPVDFMLRAIIIALVGAALFLMTSAWSFDDELPTYIFPELALGSVGTYQIGLIPALVYSGLMFGGYAIAGLILNKLYGNLNAAVVSNLTAVNSQVLLWFGATLVVFTYLFCATFANNGEKKKHNNKRAIWVTALTIFVTTIAFAANHLVTFSSGMAVTGMIASGTNDHWAMLVFLPLLASTATAVVMVLLILMLVKWGGGAGGKMKAEGEEKSVEEAKSRISKRIARKLVTEY